MMALISEIGLWCSYGMLVLWLSSAPEFIFGVTVLASVFSSSHKLQSAIQGVISLAGGFLRVLVILALLAWWIACSGAVSWMLLPLRAYLFFLSEKMHM